MKLLIFSNLYPSPWAPSMGTFNFQQFGKLSEMYDTLICVPVPFWMYLKNRTAVKKAHADNPKVKYFPYFFTPKVLRGTYGSFMYLSAKLTVMHEIKKFQPDACFASWVYPDGHCGLQISKAFNIPITLKAHGSDINVYTEDASLRAPTINVLKQVNGLVSVSQAIADKMVSFDVPAEKVSVIYNGVDKTKFYPIEDVATPEKSIVFIGNLKKDKGIFELYDAFKKFILPLGNVKLHFIGGGANLQVLKDRIAEQNLSNYIEMHGSLAHDQINQWMNKASLVCLPSYHEGVPNVLLEAMSTGTPVVATDVGGIPEVVPSSAGEIIPAKHVDALGVALVKVLNSEYDKASIIQHAQQFDWQKNAQAVSDIIEAQLTANSAA